MTLVAVLVLIGGVAGMTAVEVATAQSSDTRTAVWRVCVGTPVLLTLGLLWYSHGAPLWPLVLFMVAQPMHARRWIVRLAD